MSLPSTYHPSRPEDFVGPARKAADYVIKLARLAKDSRDPLRVIFSGPVGTGKTKLATLMAKALGGCQWNLTKFNGTQVKIEEVEELSKQFHFTDLLGGYRIVQVEELHAVPAVARSRLLTLCDDLPRGWAIIGTTKLPQKQFSALVHEDTERRYTWVEIGSPSDEEIFGLLRRNWPGIPEFSARNISTFACGCVGRALQEADAQLVAAA